MKKINIDESRMPRAGRKRFVNDARAYRTFITKLVELPSLNARECLKTLQLTYREKYKTRNSLRPHVRLELADFVATHYETKIQEDVDLLRSDPDACIEPPSSIHRDGNSTDNVSNSEDDEEHNYESEKRLEIGSKRRSSMGNMGKDEHPKVKSRRKNSTVLCNCTDKKKCQCFMEPVVMIEKDQSLMAMANSLNRKDEAEGNSCEYNVVNEVNEAVEACDNTNTSIVFCQETGLTDTPVGEYDYSLANHPRIFIKEELNITNNNNNNSIYNEQQSNFSTPLSNEDNGNINSNYDRFGAVKRRCNRNAAKSNGPIIVSTKSQQLPEASCSSDFQQTPTFPANHMHAPPPTTAGPSRSTYMLVPMNPYNSNFNSRPNMPNPKFSHQNSAIPPYYVDQQSMHFQSTINMMREEMRRLRGHVSYILSRMDGLQSQIDSAMMSQSNFPWNNFSYSNVPSVPPFNVPPPFAPIQHQYQQPQQQQYQQQQPSNVRIQPYSSPFFHCSETPQGQSATSSRNVAANTNVASNLTKKFL